MMPDFSSRVLLPELMDTEPCGPDVFRACLEDLARVNRLTGAYRPTLRFLDRAVRLMPQGRPLRILDVGGGYGDMLRRIDRWAHRRGVALRMVSVDLSPWARQAGEAAARTRQPIEWVTTDIFDYRPVEPPDLVLSSLFAHHLDDAQLVRFLRWMEATAILGWFVNDLHRHRLPYHVFRWWSRAAGWHRFVQHDGPVSIGRAFRRADWRALLQRAGIDSRAEVRWRMPFRLCVARLKPQPQA